MGVYGAKRLNVSLSPACRLIKIDFIVDSASSIDRERPRMDRDALLQSVQNPEVDILCPQLVRIASYVNPNELRI